MECPVQLFFNTEISIGSFVSETLLDKEQGQQDATEAQLKTLQLSEMASLSNTIWQNRKERQNLPKEYDPQT